MKSTRQRLLEYLETHRVATAEELSRALQVTASNARHHLTTLSSEGIVTVIGRRQRRGRGRTAQLYGLSPQAQGDNFDLLANVLLTEMLAETAPDAQTVLLKRIASRMAGDLPISGNLTQRLLSATRKLNGLGYAARWEAHADSPLIILRHCPYAAIIHEQPQLCLMDAFLIERLLSVSARQTARLTRDQRGVTFCVFETGKA